jgi:hypothetical protein
VGGLAEAMEKAEKFVMEKLGITEKPQIKTE